MISTDVFDIKIQKAEKSRIQEVDFQNLPFGKHFSDHMLIADFNGESWEQPTILPYGKIEMEPSFSALHYGQSIFEGLKAFRAANGEILIFRPQMNARRMITSAERMCMAPVPEELFLESLYSLINLDRQWVSGAEGHSLYIRPFLFGTECFLGIKASDIYRFMIITSPVASYYEGPVKVKVEPKYSRASKGGTGAAKAAGNYAASLYPARLGQQKGYRQLVWTDSSSHEFIEESGTMNIFFLIDDVLVTPSLESGTILAGVTRDSIITIAKHWGVPVEERPIPVQEIIDGIHAGRVKEAFGAGTAATIAHIQLINIREEDYMLPPVETREFSTKVSSYLTDIKSGKVDDPFGWIVRI